MNKLEVVRSVVRTPPLQRGGLDAAGALAVAADGGVASLSRHSVGSLLQAPNEQRGTVRVAIADLGRVQWPRVEEL